MVRIKFTSKCGHYLFEWFSFFRSEFCTGNPCEQFRDFDQMLTESGDDFAIFQFLSDKKYCVQLGPRIIVLHRATAR